MLCSKPYGVFGCGKCEPCMINRQRLWATRIMLESMAHRQSAFVTLTYNDEHLPVELKPRDVQLFLKRLRKKYPVPLRYFVAGEYGSRSWRPHYHLALFGFSYLDRSVLEGAWGLGFVHCGELTDASAMYVAKYAVKGFTDPESPELQGRHPEFSRMSLRPHGIGYQAAEKLGETVVSGRGASRAVAELGDVPSEVRVERARYPLGRYLRSRVREAVGWVSETPKDIRRAMAFEKSLEDGAAVRKLADKREVSRRVARSRIAIARSKRRTAL